MYFKRSWLSQISQCLFSAIRVVFVDSTRVDQGLQGQHLTRITSIVTFKKEWLCQLLHLRSFSMLSLRRQITRYSQFQDCSRNKECRFLYSTPSWYRCAQILLQVPLVSICRAPMPFCHLQIFQLIKLPILLRFFADLDRPQVCYLVLLTFY